MTTGVERLDMSAVMMWQELLAQQRIHLAQIDWELADAVGEVVDAMASIGAYPPEPVMDEERVTG